MSSKMKEYIINCINQTLQMKKLLFDSEKWLQLMSKLLRTREPDGDSQQQFQPQQQQYYNYHQQQQLPHQQIIKLQKCLKTRDLVSLGVGSCVGTGMYLVAGMVAKNLAGPAVIISFLIAGIASLLSGVCYAEFGVRVPNTSGSAYMYSYVTVGEFIAFVIGWNMILEYLIGSAAGAAAISACIDSMYNGRITEWIRSRFGTFVGHTPDLFAALITIAMTLILATGVKKSLLFTNILNIINFSMWFLIIMSSLVYLDFHNWSSSAIWAATTTEMSLSSAATTVTSTSITEAATTTAAAIIESSTTAAAIFESTLTTTISQIDNNSDIILNAYDDTQLTSDNNDQQQQQYQETEYHPGGFAPYGWSGILNGAATCFYAFIGFDIIATTGEETENPQRSIPIAIVTSMVIALIAYISSGLIITLVIPYWQIDMESPIVSMFAMVGANRCKVFAAIGALAGLFVSMFGSMFPMPRVVYAMAKDGLIYQEFSQISPFTNTPVRSTLIFGLFTAFIALIMSLEVLVEMMSIGTLMAYTLVSACVLLLRYQPTKTNIIELLPQSIRSHCVTPSKEYPPTQQPTSSSMFPQPPSFVCPSTASATTTQAKSSNQIFKQQCFSKKLYESSDSCSGGDIGGIGGIVGDGNIRRNYDYDDDDYDPNCWSRQASKDDEFLVPGAAGYHYGSVPYQHGGSSSRRYGLLDKYDKLIMYLFPYGWQINTPATDETGQYVAQLVAIFLLLTVIFDIILAWNINSILNWNNNNHLLLFIFIFIFISIIIIILIISRQPQIRCNLKFKAPGVPFVPAIAIMINIYLILRLSILTLVRFTVWMIIGLFIYFGYGINHSVLEQQQQQQMSSDQQPPSLSDDKHFNGLSQNQHQQQQPTTIELNIPSDRLKQTFSKTNPFLNPEFDDSTATTTNTNWEKFD